MTRNNILYSLAMDNNPDTLASVVNQDNYLFPKTEILEKRDELINKPIDNDDTPVWARWKAQTSTGNWVWFEVMPSRSSTTWGVSSSFLSETANSGLLPTAHDWRYTLEPVYYELDWDGSGNPPKKTRCRVSIDNATYRQAIIIAYHDDHVWLELKTSQVVKPLTQCRFLLITNDESETIRQMATLLSPTDTPSGYKTMARRVYQAVQFNTLSI